VEGDALEARRRPRGVGALRRLVSGPIGRAKSLYLLAPAAVEAAGRRE
jgi:hypothetical protein